MLRKKRQSVVTGAAFRLTLVAMSACSPSKFASSAARSPVEPAAPVPTSDEQQPEKPKVEATEAIIPGIEVSAVPSATAAPTPFSGGFEFRTTLNRQEIWVVSANSVVRIRLVDGYPQTNWTMPPNSGNRTFVSQIGLLIGRTMRGGNGGLFRAGDDTSGVAQLVYTPPDAVAESRMCPSSFLVDGKPHIGLGYVAQIGTNKVRKFVRFAIDETKPSRVDLSQLKEVTHPQPAGVFDTYSCYIDQARGFAWYSGSTTWGVDVRKLAPLMSSSAPNFGATNDAFNLSQSERRSYALAGDLEGNLLSATGVYTFAHDPVSKMVFGATGGNITVTAQECFRSANVACKATKHHQFAALSRAAIGPMSSLGDGRVAAIQRGNPSQVFLVSLKEVANPAAGIEIKKVADIAGDAYMYNDFTGATLYAPTSEKSFELAKLSGFSSGKEVAQLKFRWIAESGLAEEWRGLKLAMRCHSGSEKKPEYFMISKVAVAGTFIDAPKETGCIGKVNTVEVKVEADGVSSSFSRAQKIEFEGSVNP